MPGARDVYTFDGTAGGTLRIDELAASGTLALDYVLLAPSGAVVGTGAIGGADFGPVVLPETGTYEIVVGEDRNDAVGTDSFQVLP